MAKHDTTGGARRRRRIPRWWACILMLVPVGLVVWLQTGDRTGDGGMTNVLSILLGAITAVVLMTWVLLFARGYRFRSRLAALLAVLVVLVAGTMMFRPVGFTGSMIPIFEPRWRRAPVFEPITLPAGVDVDLHTTTPHDFPGFLGPGRDLHVSGVTLARDWDAQPPHVMWRQPIGAGWSGFAIVNGVAVTQEERDGTQLVTAYDARTGAALWAHRWAGAYAHPMGGPGPRTTPTIDGGRVYALGPFGRLLCLDGADGTVIWQVDLLDAYGISPEREAATIAYGRSNSPLVHGDRVIVPVGGAGAEGGDLRNLVAFDARTGEPVWEGSPHQISYSSPALATVAGIEQLLIVNESSVSGHDPATGRQLWEHPWPGRSQADATSSQVWAVGDASVFVSKGYGVGSARLDLAPSGDGSLAVTQRWHQRRSLRTKHTNALIRDGHAYGLSDGILECIELEGGRRVWKEGRYGHGQILGVGDMMLVLSEQGEVVLIEPTPATPNAVHGTVQAIDGLTWNNLAFSGDLLLVRNGSEATALQLPLRE